MSDAATNDHLKIVISKLEEMCSRVGTIEERMNRLAYDGEKTQKRLKAIIQLQEQERRRNEDLEKINKDLIEKVTRMRANYVHLWDRADTLLWMRRSGIEGEETVIKQEEEEASELLGPATEEEEEVGGHEEPAEGEEVYDWDEMYVAVEEGGEMEGNTDGVDEMEVEEVLNILSTKRGEEI